MLIFNQKGQIVRYTERDNRAKTNSHFDAYEVAIEKIQALSFDDKAISTILEIIISQYGKDCRLIYKLIDGETVENGDHRIKICGDRVVVISTTPRQKRGE